MTVWTNTSFRGRMRVLTATATLLTAVPTIALAAPPTMKPEAAEQSRQSTRTDAAADLDAGNFAEAGYTFDVAAGETGDPMLFLDASDAYLSQGEADRSIEMAETAINRAEIARDILYFLDDDDQYGASDYHVLSEDDVDSAIGRANATIGTAEELIETIRAEEAAGDEPDEPRDEVKKEKKPIKPGTGMVIGGTVGVVIGLGGIGMMAAFMATAAGVQTDVDALDPNSEMDQNEFERLDTQGKQANILTGVGIGIGVVGLAVGATLIALGAKKMKESGGGKEKASAMVVPTGTGLALVGRF